MRTSALVLTGTVLAVGVFTRAQSPAPGHASIATEADFQRAMKELSNWGRWGANDELGAANLITPAKRKQALALAREGLTVSLSHDVIQEKAVDAPTTLERTLVTASPTV